MQQAPSPLHVKDISSFVPALLSSHSQMHLIKCQIATFAIPPYGHPSLGHSEPPSSSSPSAHRSEQLWRKSFYAASNPASGSPESSSSLTGILSMASKAFLDQILPCGNWRISFRRLRHLSQLAALRGSSDTLTKGRTQLKITCCELFAAIHCGLIIDSFMSGLVCHFGKL